MENKFTKITNNNEWQDLLNKVLFRTFFHNSDWEDFLEKQFKWLKFERYVYDNSVLLSLARVGDKLISHPFCEYGGPMPLVEKIDGEKFKQDLFSEFKNPLRISLHPRLLNYFNETRPELVSSSNDTYFIKIKELSQISSAQIPSDFRKTLRHSIKKYKDKALLETGSYGNKNNLKELKDLYGIYLNVEKKHKTIPYPLSFFEFFLKSPNSEIILSKYKNKVIAGSVFLFYDKFIHYFKNASDERYDDLGANYLILWHQIHKYTKKDQGGWGHGDYDIFDLGGTRRGSNLEVFKRGWGSVKYSIFELSNYQKSGSRDSKLRNVFGLLPQFLVKKLSPYLLKYKY